IDLLAYRSAQMKKLEAIQELPTLEVPATVTFNKPINYADLEMYLSSVQIINIKYVSSPEGAGSIPYPNDMYELDELRSFENYLSNKIRSLTGIRSFKLIKGYVAATVTGRPDKLLEIGRIEKEVFLVDIGASSWLHAYPNAIIEPGDDLYYELKYFHEPNH
ncbi:MAG: hypothetical protein WAW41_13645, partial [Methylobacter sp.]